MKLDIRPTFILSALEQEGPVRKGIRKMIQVAGGHSFRELLVHKGVHLEKIPGMTAPDGSDLYTLRVTLAARAIATVKGDVLVLFYVEPDHDAAYR